MQIIKKFYYLKTDKKVCFCFFFFNISVDLLKTPANTLETNYTQVYLITTAASCILPARLHVGPPYPLPAPDWGTRERRVPVAAPASPLALAAAYGAAAGAPRGCVSPGPLVPLASPELRPPVRRPAQTGRWPLRSPPRGLRRRASRGQALRSGPGGSRHSAAPRPLPASAPRPAPPPPSARTAKRGAAWSGGWRPSPGRAGSEGPLRARPPSRAWGPARV